MILTYIIMSVICCGVFIGFVSVFSEEDEKDDMVFYAFLSATVWPVTLIGILTRVTLMKYKKERE